MFKTTYSANSSTRDQARQLNQDEQQFATMLDQMRNDGKAPTSSEIDQAGDLASILSELKDSLEVDGIPGLEKTLQAYSASNKRLNTLLATIEANKAQAKAEEDDKRTRLDQRGKRIFVTMSEDEVDDLPDIEWLISGILQTATVSLVFGDSNVGKTFFALHTAQCVARGLQWYGRDIKPGPVLYIYAEGIRGLKPRSQAWRQHNKAGKANNIRFIGFPVHLIAERETLLDTLSSLEDQYDEKHALIVIDTFSNCAGGINQNDQMEIAKVLATAQDIVRDYGAHVMVVHHTNKQGMANGSLAFKNHTDTQIELKKSDATGPIIMRCEKQRDAEYFKDILLELQVIDLGTNPTTLESLTSCVMVLSQSKMPGVEKAEQERETMLDLLKEHGTLTQRQWMELCNTELGISRKPFERYLEYLKDHKSVTWTPEDPKPRQAINYKAMPTMDDVLNSILKDKNGASDK